MSVSSQSEIDLAVTANAGVEVKKFMDAEGVTAEQGGLRVSVQPGGCSGFKYSLVIEDRAAEDDLVIPREGFNVFTYFMFWSDKEQRWQFRGLASPYNKLKFDVVQQMYEAAPHKP